MNSAKIQHVVSIHLQLDCVIIKNKFTAISTFCYPIPYVKFYLSEVKF